MNFNELHYALGDWIMEFERFPSSLSVADDICRRWEDSVIDEIARLEIVDELHTTDIEKDLEAAIMLAKKHNHDMIPDIYRRILLVKDYMDGHARA